MRPEMTHADLCALLHRITEELTGDRRERAETVLNEFETTGFSPLEDAVN